MAFVTLTDAQKDTLLQDGQFQSEVKWGILNKASYWLGQDGTSVPGGQFPIPLIRWAKSRRLASEISLNPSMAEQQQIIRYFLFQAKNIACVDNSQAFSASTVVAQLLIFSSFDSLADQWFDSQIQAYAF